MRPRTILVAAWIGFLLYSFPGYMRLAAIDQLTDSRVGAFTDWAPPAMTEAWRVVGRVIAGPAGLLLLQSALLLGGTYALVRRAASDRFAAVAAAVVLLAPPIAMTTAEIAPEPLLAALLVAGTAAILDPRRAVRMLGLVLLLLASAMRDGGTVAILPIVVIGFAWHHAQAGWRRYAIAVATWAVLAGGAAACNATLVDTETQRPQDQLAALDVAGILRFAPPITDSSIRRALAGTPLVPTQEIQRFAHAPYAHPEQLFDGSHRLFDVPTTDDGHAALASARWTLARAYPRAYAAHRWYQFVRELGVFRNHRMSVYSSFVQPAEVGGVIHHDARHSLVQRGLVACVRWIGRTWLSRPVVYLALAIVLLPLAIRRRERVAAMLLASAILYELSLAVSSASIAYEHSLPLVMFTVVAAALLLARWLEARRERVRGEAPVAVAHDDHVDAGV